MPTLTTYRRAIASKLGDFKYGTISSATSSTVVDATLASSIAQDDYYDDYYLFIPSAGATDKLRLVDTFSPESGTFTPDRSYGSIPSGAYELHPIIEPYTEMTDIINTVLKRLMIVNELTITSPTPIHHRQDISSSMGDWLLNPNWIRQVGYLSSSGDREHDNPYDNMITGKIEQLGAKTYLSHPGWSFQSTDTIYLLVCMPAYYYCKATAWGDQDGLSAEADEALPAVDWVAVAGAREALDRYSNIINQKANANVLKDTSQLAAEFTGLTHLYFNNVIPPKTFGAAPMAWGPRWS